MRKRIQDHEKRRLVEEWDQSGLSAAAFCKPHGLHPATLGAWGREVRGRLRRSSQKQPAERSVEVVEVRRDAVGEVRVEFELGKDRRLIVSGALTAEMIVELAVSFEAVGAQ